MLNLINLYLEESIAVSKTIDQNSLKKLVDLVIDCYKNENAIFAFGNGGNCGFVSNLVNDLNFLPFSSDDKKNQYTKRNRFKAVSLCDSGTTLTGIANDFSYDEIFSEQLKFQANKNDILVGFSGSGNSKNILKAFEYGRQIGTKNVLLTRNQTNKISEYSDLVICVCGTSTFPGQVGGNNNNFHFEDFTSKVSHIVCGILRSYVQTNPQ
jgi:D-sedoheptulose 7-phosphate isomerase